MSKNFNYFSNQFTEANTISQLLTANDADEEQALLYYNTLIGAGLDGRWAHQLNTTELNTIRTITATEAPIHHHAKALLHFYYQKPLQRINYEFNNATRLANIKKDITTNQPENIDNSKIYLYPNPAKDEVNIQFDNISDVDKLLITITDVLGKIVLQQAIVLNNNRFVFTTDKLQNGIYTCKIMNGDRKFEMKKLVVVK